MCELNSIVDDIALKLWEAEHRAKPILPCADQIEANGIAEAYRIQRVNITRGLEAGRVLRGRKIGLTSRAVQKQPDLDYPSRVASCYVFGIAAIRAHCSISESGLSTDIGGVTGSSVAPRDRSSRTAHSCPSPTDPDAANAPRIAVIRCIRTLCWFARCLTWPCFAHVPLPTTTHAPARRSIWSQFC